MKLHSRMTSCTQKTFVPSLFGLFGLAALTAAIWPYFRLPADPRSARAYHTRLQAALWLIPSAFWLYSAYTMRPGAQICHNGRMMDRDKPGLYDAIAFGLLCAYWTWLARLRSSWGVGRRVDVLGAVLGSSVVSLLLLTLDANITF
ncbi:uncharacterized protein F5Z01DRAFT_456961 [Emericellopsis atlantica]|uniref:Uncharacterized protein n=1 Tax=Emericellopsis atlantica TaxID=2614577 RepID=A0A9P8CSG6_9HYPO|nr:uncharacterized protein F5Z01DRAFT_456961 [Emericellopsis atlantica]KAG9257190.1 hypothetical protein F5Z01DRAFT_456961 [Emericellopsis atlantica]